MHGRGTHVDVSIQEVQVGSLEGAGPAALTSGSDATRSGNQLRAIWGIYPCADGYVGCFCLDGNIPNLLAAIERPDLLDSPFRDPQWRMAHNDEIAAMLTSFFLDHTQAELMELGMRHRVPLGIMPTIAELLEWPGLLEKGFWQELDHPEAGCQTYPGPPFTVDGGGFALRRAPRLGEHAEAVLSERLGMTAAEIAELRQAGVI
jgi:crotonobetainyl-CoA:carnitine CoA-transferase CaiB-like acyl-CoA transferase